MTFEVLTLNNNSLIFKFSFLFFILQFEGSEMEADSGIEDDSNIETSSKASGNTHI
jgi:hypothetical protein